VRKQGNDKAYKAIYLGWLKFEDAGNSFDISQFVVGEFIPEIDNSAFFLNKTTMMGQRSNETITGQFGIPDTLRTIEKTHEEVFQK
jgi:hypothetical protein